MKEKKKKRKKVKEMDTNDYGRSVAQTTIITASAVAAFLSFEKSSIK